MLYKDRDSFKVQIRQRGQLTIPSKLRDSLNIEDGDVLTLLPVGDLLVLAPTQLRTPQLTDQLADLLESSEVTLADLLADLPRIRETLVNERYGSDSSE